MKWQQILDELTEPVLYKVKDPIVYVTPEKLQELRRETPTGAWFDMQRAVFAKALLNEHQCTYCKSVGRFKDQNCRNCGASDSNITQPLVEDVFMYHNVRFRIRRASGL